MRIIFITGIDGPPETGVCSSVAGQPQALNSPQHGGPEYGKTEKRNVACMQCVVTSVL